MDRHESVGTDDDGDDHEGEHGQPHVHGDVDAQRLHGDARQTGRDERLDERDGVVRHGDADGRRDDADEERL